MALPFSLHVICKNGIYGEEIKLMNFIQTIQNTNIKLILLFLYLVMNLIVFCMYALDKYKARRQKWRIPERTLLIGAVFGIFGAILGMLVMHHKTRKLKFQILVPLILLLEVAAAAAYILKFVLHVI